MLCIGGARTEFPIAARTHTHTPLDLYLGPQVLDHLQLLTKFHPQRGRAICPRGLFTDYSFSNLCGQNQTKVCSVLRLMCACSSASSSSRGDSPAVPWYTSNHHASDGNGGLLEAPSRNADRGHGSPPLHNEWDTKSPEGFRSPPGGLGDICVMVWQPY